MRILISSFIEGVRLSFNIYKSYRNVIRKFFHDELAKQYIIDIDFINYRLYVYATCTQKMTKEAFELELKREFRTSTANILEAYGYLRSIGFYDIYYDSAIELKEQLKKMEA